MARFPRGHWMVKENVLNDAKSYRYQTEWSRASGGAFMSARRNGWLEEACAHMKSPKAAMGHWTKERLIADAQRYSGKAEWKKANASAYATALQKGYLAECTTHMTPTRKPDGYWTKELCMESASRYSTIIAWSLSEGAAYDAAKRGGWYKDCTANMQKTYSLGEYTIYCVLLEHDILFEHQKRFNDLKLKRHLPYDFYLPGFNLVIEYQGRQHFETSKTSMYRSNLNAQQERDAIKVEYARKKGLNYLSIEAQKPAEIEKALMVTLAQLAVARRQALKLTRRELSEHEISLLSNLGTWTKEAVIADARKHRNIRDWRANGNGHVYNIALRNGWLEEASSHFVQLQKPKGYWTKERIREDALKYRRKIDWLRESRSAYTIANAKGWLEEVTAHMRQSESN